MRAAAKRFTYDGDKDKNEARTMSDRLGDVDGFRTSVESLSDRDVMLRTRGGEPEVTTRFKPKQEGVNLVEPKYQDRVFFTKSAGGVDFTLSSALQFLAKVILRYGKRLTLSKPPAKEAGLADTEFYYAGERIFSTDALFSFITCAPKKGRVSGALTKFKRMGLLPRNATVAEIEAPVEGELRREMFQPRLMETTTAQEANATQAYWHMTRLGRLLKFIVTPVKKVRVTVNGVPKWITFDEPSPTASGGSDYGQYALKTNPFDHVRCFGQVYHGLLDTVTNTLTLDNGATHFGDAMQVHDHGATYVEFPRGEVPTDQSLLPSGLSFKKYAILSGVYYQYNPLNQLVRFETPWLYSAPDGAVYAIRVSRTHSGLEARLVDMMYVEEAEDGIGPWQNDYYWAHVFDGPVGGVISCSKDGAIAVASYSQASYGGSAGLHERFLFPGCDTKTGAVTHGKWSSFAVSGGSFSSLPNIVETVHTETIEDNLPSSPGGTGGTGRAFAGAMVTKDGTIVKAFNAYTYTASYEHGVVSAERIEVWAEVGAVNLLVDAVTYTADVVQNPPGEGPWGPTNGAVSYDVDLGRTGLLYRSIYFAAGVNVHNNGLFTAVASNGFATPAAHKITYVGTLGQTLDTGVQVIATDVVNSKGYTQHPVSGAILVDKIPF